MNPGLAIALAVDCNWLDAAATPPTSSSST